MPQARPRIDEDRVYAFIVGYKAEHDGISPSYREIAEGCNLSGVSSVLCALNRLADAGRIERVDGSNRSIAVVGGHWSLPEVGA